ncbi:MAG: cobalamin-dependent protein [Candidatus Woesearchaeota archaeon]
MNIGLISAEYDLSSNGLRLLSSVLKKYGHSVTLIFMPYFNNKYPRSVLKKLYALICRMDMIGFSSMALSSQKVIQIIKSIREKKFDGVIIWGGIHATLNPDECLMYADYVCVGEGEFAFAELAYALHTRKTGGRKIKNIRGRHSRVCKIRPLVMNLDSLPFEDYSLAGHLVLENGSFVPMQEKHFTYGLHNLSNEFFNKVRGSFVTIHCIRGCHSSCTYCCNYDLKKIYHIRLSGTTSHASLLRKRSLGHVISQLRQLKKNIPSLAFVWFTDDDFFVRSRDEISAFIAEYKKHVALPFMCYAGPKSIEKTKLSMLVSAGLCRVEVGIQTGSRRVSSSLYNRKMANREILRAARTLNKFKTRMYPPEYQLIGTNPNETLKDIGETLKLIEALPKPFFLRVFNLTYFPGSTYYKNALEDMHTKECALKSFTLEYGDTIGHFKIKTGSGHCLVLSLLQGQFNSIRYGKVPRFLFPLIKSSRGSNFAQKIFYLWLRVCPYNLIFVPFPYPLRAAYIRSYIFIYSRIYLPFSRTASLIGKTKTR